VLIIELLSTPSHITLLGEGDDNWVRRIYADSHQHPEDPDLTQDGHSIGHWEGNALVIGTTAIMPQAFIAIIEAVGIPNDGDMHIIERLHLAGPNVLHDDLEITELNVLTATWNHTDFPAVIGQGGVSAGGPASGQGLVRQQHIRFRTRKTPTGRFAPRNRE